MRRGFSLLEGIVAMGILLIITTFGVANYNYTSKKQAVETTAEKLRQTLIQAKSNLASGKKNCSICGCTGGVSDSLLSGWKVLITDSNKTFTLIGYCGINFVTTFSTSTIIYNGGVTINEAVNNSPVVTFIPPNGATYGNVAKDFVISNSTVSRRVRVNQMGSVWVE